MTRTRRVAGSVALSLMSQVVAMVVGLWLTRFILDRLGQSTFGLWFIILQALGWLALTDLGVVGILPRQVAFATGKDAPAGALGELASRATRLVLWQWPGVMALCAAAWFLVPVSGAGRQALGIVLLSFAVAFPLRVFGAVLQGLQDLVFLGWVQFAAWALGTAVTVGGLVAGLALNALALSWGVMLLLPALVLWRRLAARFPEAVPRRLPRLSWADARQYLARAWWVALGQLSSVLASGADVLIIGLVVGPAAVVPYVLTLKLVAVIGNWPMTMAHASGPALSQMRAGESREDLRRATGALAAAVLTASGAVACVIMAVNESFVGWWVGADQYAGTWVTLLGIALMMLGHYGSTIVYTVYSFGHERRLALSGIVQGVVTAAAAWGLVRLLGPAGAILGGLVGVGTLLPLLLPTLAADTDATVRRLVVAVLPFGARVLLALAAAAALGRVIEPRSLPGLALAAVLAVAVYAAVMLPAVLRPPLREYALQLWRAALARLSRAGPTVPPTPSAPAVV